ncbi:Intraflagellar transport protein [Phytophthora fragariae]|uniref:Intraflagellar transport protein 122 homolog n=1 Tax=Phytophthora fragariae TaxID=53985 RepID=A0A6A3E9S8_9STRA|nr:Intraflagellar transport protein [Phytophthora fragariae]KAE8930432.1 Intraflagellar transport protein [Phytophthora fragariae]KAE8992667.1 Intraflagellar transport protein [Phytophthora fragariae]KAE9091972.1 Intraflagellar transport protein [Phytophthora fragariae]KAE9092210.1 Intraflagellar transport protein [Phytophthora fragariae]
MRSVLAWSDKVPERNGEKFVVQDLAFRPDGSQVVAAVGTRVLVYDAVDGTLLHSLKGHKGTVYAVDYSHDGKRFASGGADNIVIIWTDKAEGILKYTHNDSIQKLAYNPQSQCLASCTASDFGLWAPEQKSVAKHKVVAKILSACWSKDGQVLALGLLNGNVTLRDKLGAEKRLIERSNAPVWALAWSPAHEDDSTDILAVGCWDRTLAFYTPSGVMQGKARKLAFNPTSLTYFSKGKYLLVGGSNRKAGLYTKDGIFLVGICEQESWVWAIKARPKTNFVGVGSEDGTLSMYCLVFGTVHGIYQERYAYREHLTDVIVQHLMTEQKVRIKTRDCVKKLSVYRDRLAVQLSDRIIIYELAGNNGSGTATNASYDMHYRVKERITKDLPCSLLVVTSLHFILCQKQKLQQYDFTGRKEREWVLESLIRYIKVTGGAPGREGLLVGLKDGSVWQIFINNPFPIPLIQQSSPISCLDISANREKLAVVDDSHKCLVYALATKQLLFEEGATNSVAWNTECEDMLCFGGNGQLKIRAGQFPGHTQRMQGFVVGFSGSKVFSLSALSVQTIDVPQSAPLYRYLEQNNFPEAYAVSCLGVTAADWRLLAWEALKSMRFSVARKAFIRVRDVRYIELVNALEQTWKQQMPQLGGEGSSNQEGEDVGGEAGKKVKALLQAEIMAHQGKFPLAAKLFADCGEPARAIKMFADLRMWDEAKRFAKARQAGDVQQLVLAQARWAEDVQDWRAAAEMYAASGNYVRAGEILGEHGWLDELLELTRKPDAAASSRLLTAAADFFLKGGQFANARDMYLKLGDLDALLQMHIRLQEWEEAVRLADRHRDSVRRPDEVFVPYAQWLVTQDRFDDALDAYTRAQRPDQCSKLLCQLIDNAVSERRFRSAAYYHWRLCEQQMKTILDPKQETTGDVELNEEQRAKLAAAMENELLSELYYAYAMIYAFTDEPFTTLLPESLFHAARFLLNKLAARGSNGRTGGGTVVVAPPPPGISLSNIYFTLGHHALQLESYKLARQAYDKLLQMKLRLDWEPVVECTAMTLQARPYADREELLPVDYRSSTVNPLLNPNNTGDVCINSGHPFVRSFVSFENLPLVEFQPEPGISDDEAEQLILTHPSDSGNNSKRTSGGWRETDYGNGSQSMKLDDDDPEPVDDSARDGGDLFEQALNKKATYGPSVGHRSGAAQYRVLQLDARTLRALRPNEVFIVKYPTRAVRPKFYKNMIPEIKIHLSPQCRRFFHEEDFEFEYLKAGHCPCCQVAELAALNPPAPEDDNDAADALLNGSKLKK